MSNPKIYNSLAGAVLNQILHFVNSGVSFSLFDITSSIRKDVNEENIVIASASSKTVIHNDVKGIALDFIELNESSFEVELSDRGFRVFVAKNQKSNCSGACSKGATQKTSAEEKIINNLNNLLKKGIYSTTPKKIQSALKGEKITCSEILKVCENLGSECCVKVNSDYPSKSEIEVYPF